MFETMSTDSGRDLGMIIESNRRGLLHRINASVELRNSKSDISLTYISQRLGFNKSRLRKVVKLMSRRPDRTN